MQLNELKRDPSRPLSDVRLATYRDDTRTAESPSNLPEEAPPKKWWKFFYDRDKKTFCERSCKSWCYIVCYSIFYIIFLCTFTMILLYISLCIVKRLEVYNVNPENLLLFTGHGTIGLTATPTSVHKMPLIWYEDGESRDYEKYVTALEKLVTKRNLGENKQLGPCGTAPFGYGDTPCVIIRINRHYGSIGIPIKHHSSNSSDIPPEVKLWAKMDSKLWLHCAGSNPYDAEHVGAIKYYPHPPGFNPGSYAPRNDSSMQLIGVQFSNFTKGIALAIECSLIYDGGKSRVNFVLYVSNSRKVKLN